MIETRSLRVLAIAGLFAGLLGACGGGGGDSTPAVPIADTAEAWWNQEAAGRWAFTVTDTRPGLAGSRVNLVTIEPAPAGSAPGIVNFVHSTGLVDGERMEEPRFFDGSAIQAVVDLATGEAYPEVPAPLLADVKTTIYDDSEAIDFDGDGVTDGTLRLLVTVALATEASRTVPAGSFSNVLRARTEITVSVTVPALAYSDSVTSSLTTWYAPGVGPIRREYVDPLFSAPNNVAYEELSGVSLAAVKAGTVPGFVVLDAIGAGTDSGIAGIPAMASDGSNVLIVSNKEAGASDTLVGAIMAPDGTRLWQGTLVDDGSSNFNSLYAAASFDGLNYQVFWVRPSDGVLVGQRLSPSGTVLGPLAGTPVGAPIGTSARLAAASDGSNVLLVWQRFANGTTWVTEGQLIDRNGQAIPATSFSLATGEADVSVARSGAGYLIARASPQGGTVGFVRVSDTGVLLDADWQEIAGSGPFATDPRVTVHPDGFLVGWTSWASSPNAGITNTLLSRRIAFDGNVLDAADVAIDANPISGRFGFALTGSGQGLFAGWVKDLTLDPMQTADRARVARAPWASGAPVFGTPGSYWYTTPALQPPPDAYPVAVAAGDRYVMAWLENLQSAATPSDRVVATIVHPPTAR